VSFEMASKQNSWPILKTHPFLRSRNWPENVRQLFKKEQYIFPIQN
jgi:hypothetical protein